MHNKEKKYYLTITYVRNKSANPIVINIELLLDFISFRSCDVIYLFVYLFHVKELITKDLCTHSQSLVIH